MTDSRRLVLLVALALVAGAALVPPAADAHHKADRAEDCRAHGGWNTPLGCIYPLDFLGHFLVLG